MRSGIGGNGDTRTQTHAVHAVHMGRVTTYSRIAEVSLQTGDLSPELPFEQIPTPVPAEF